MEYREFRQLHARPDAVNGAVVRLPVPRKEGANEGACFAIECAAVARALVEQGTDGLGVSSWSEVAVLCPRVRWLEEAARALRAVGLPCRRVSSRETRREVPGFSWPAALARVIACPTDRFELVGVLREVFAVSDPVITRAFTAVTPPPGAPFEYRTSDPTLRAALQMLAGLHTDLGACMEAGTFSLPRFWALVVDRTALAARLATLGHDTAPLEALAWRACDSTDGPVAFDEWSQQLMDELALRPPESGEDGGGAVQLMSMHKSKGLEWPVVAVPGLARAIHERGGNYPRVISRGNDAELHLQNTTIDPDLTTHRQLRKRAEYQRLAYVALTRAKRLLILPDTTDLYPQPKSAQTERKRFSMNEHMHWPDWPGEVTVDRPPTVAAPTAPALTPDPVKIDRAILEAARAVCAARPRRVLPHELAHVAEERIAAPGGADVEPITGWETGGIDYGNWWHQTMEACPWGRVDHIDAWKKQSLATVPPAMAERGGAEIQALVMGAFWGELWKRGEHFHAELPFSHPDGQGRWIEGVMDLVVTDRDGGLWVVDWKTNRPRTGEDIHVSLRGQYAPQLEAYAAALQAASGREVTRRLLVSTSTGEAVEV